MDADHLREFKTFGDLLRHLRLKARLTQRELGLGVGYGDAQINRLEKNLRLPDGGVVASRFLDALDLRRDSVEAQRLLELATKVRGDTLPVQQEQAAGVQARTNLFAQRTSFIGREQEIVEVKALLGSTRLLTLTGVGGCGKTRLAIQVARDVLAQFADGVWWVELAAAREDERVLQLVVKAVGLVESQQLSPLETLLNHLGTKQALLVIDNCEHLVKACAELADSILTQCPHIQILTTSREALSISGEIAWLVPSLSLPASDNLDTPEHLLQSESIRLFVERARAVRLGFVLTLANAPAVANICRRLDGIPLALELAAARLKVLTVDQINARLDDRFGLLTTGSRTALPRQQTLRAAIDWSYELLTAEEQALFRRLAVFSGGCTLDAALAFLEIDNDLAFTAEDGLSALIDKSLVARREDGDGQSRYSMLETIREYALEKLQEHNEYDVWMERLALYMVAQDVDEDWNHLTPIGADNWRTVMTWLQDVTKDAELRFRTVWLGRALVGPPEEALWLERVLAHPQSVTLPMARARALWELGVKQRIIGDLKRAHDHLEQCLTLCREHKFSSFMDDVFIDSVLEQLGMVAREQDELERAREYFVEGLTLARELDHDWTSASICTGLAEVETMAENALEAKRLLVQTLEAIRKRVSDHPFHPLLIGWATNYMGHVALLEGNLVEAKEWVAQSVQAFESLGPDRGERMYGRAWDHHCLGEIALIELDAVAADSNFKQAIAFALKHNDNPCISWCLVGLGGAYALDEEPERGAQLWGAGEGLRQGMGCRIAPASRLNRERTVALLREQLGEAEFERLTVEGRAMSLEQAIAHALTEANS